MNLRLTDKVSATAVAAIVQHISAFLMSLGSVTSSIHTEYLDSD